MGEENIQKESGTSHGVIYKETCRHAHRRTHKHVFMSICERKQSVNNLKPNIKDRQ